MPKDVIDKDLGWEKIKQTLSKNSDTAVRVGVIDGLNGTPTGVAQYAFYNEYGRGPPERPALRNALIKNKKKILKAQEDFANGILEGRVQNVDLELNKIGAMVQSEMRNSIVRLKSPPNAPSTILKKRSANPLIDEGIYRRSISWSIEKKSVAGALASTISDIGQSSSSVLGRN